MREWVILHARGFLLLWTLLQYKIETRAMAPCVHHLKCANNASCRTVVTTSDTRTWSYDECLCHGGFTGSRCDVQLSLHVNDVTDSSAYLNAIGTRTPKRMRGTVQYEEVSSSSYSNARGGFKVQYWSNESEPSCHIIPVVHSDSYIISGLHSSRLYTICIGSTFEDLCFSVGLENTSRSPPNCALIQTSPYSGMANVTKVAILIGVCILFITFLCLILIIVIFKIKRLSCRQLCSGQCQCYNCCTTCPRPFNKTLLGRKWSRYSMRGGRRKGDRFFVHATELRLLSESSASGRQTDNNLSPGGSGRRSHPALRTFASYSVQNDRGVVMTAIVQYGHDDDSQSEDGDSLRAVLVTPDKGSVNSDSDCEM